MAIFPDVTRVVLVAPPATEPVKTPLLAFAYLAASLRRGGHEVAVVDAAAPGASRDNASIAATVRALEPDLVGIHTKTLEVQHAYSLARVLAETTDVPLVAGGPHATVRSEEPLAHEFRYVLRGEAERSLVALADALAGTTPLAAVPGLTWSDRGIVRSTPAHGFLRDLDALAEPLSALDVFEPSLYPVGDAGVASPAPAGLLSSRGCPAACTFCSNDVTGRTFRYHSPARVASEASRMKHELGTPAFAFFDDSFAVGRRRVAELTRALEHVGAAWTCTAHPRHLDRETLRAMKRAGCGGVDIGLESAHPERLERIGKGVTVERVHEVLETAAELGIHTVVNLMLLWPDETRDELDALSSFMERAAPFAGGFNCRGVLVPHPGTPEYELHHERHGFTEWWVREAPLPYDPFPSSWDPSEVLRAYSSDAALERNFFRHPSRHIEHARTVLAEKATRTLARVSGGVTPTEVAVPAAGAR